MRHLKTLLLVAVFAFSGTVFASNTNDAVQPVELSEEISELLKDPYFTLKDEVVTKVTFMLNKDNEMVVLDVDSDENLVEKFIKSRLNYKELPSAYKTNYKKFIVPVRLQPGQ